MANISRRVSIRWLPDPPAEPTSTIVLTSAGRHYVDLRIMKPMSALPEDQIQGSHHWAFAGTSISDPREGGGSHAIWRHWVDSLYVNAETFVDEGYMCAQEDGSELEKGRMLDPDTGTVRDYEEVWKEVEPLSSDGGKTRCVVLQLEEEHVRGLIIRLGQYCQGIVRVEQKWTAERWEWIEGRRWERAALLCEPRRSDLTNTCMASLPYPTILEDRDFKVGESVRAGDHTWKVIESTYGDD